MTTLVAPFVDGLDEADRDLLAAAAEVRRNAYAPYSNFLVGAAVRGRSGRIHRAANMENASYGLTTCAEQGALAAAVAAADFDVMAIAVVGGPAVPHDPGGAIVRPCGRCRQLIAEAAQVSGVDIQVLSANSALTRHADEKISTLLPDAFAIPV